MNDMRTTNANTAATIQGEFLSVIHGTEIGVKEESDEEPESPY